MLMVVIVRFSDVDESDNAIFDTCHRDIYCNRWPLGTRTDMGYIDGRDVQREISSWICNFQNNYFVNIGWAQ
jgi:hypothetical protein